MLDNAHGLYKKFNHANPLIHKSMLSVDAALTYSKF